MFKINHREITIYVEHKVSRCIFFGAYCSELSIRLYVVINMHGFHSKSFSQKIEIIYLLVMVFAIFKVSIRYFNFKLSPG